MKTKSMVKTITLAKMTVFARLGQKVLAKINEVNTLSYLKSLRKTTDLIKRQRGNGRLAKFRQIFSKRSYLHFWTKAKTVA